MKLFIASCLFAAVAAGRLENTYLPPGNAPTAGGNGNFLSAPSAKYLPANTNSHFGAFNRNNFGSQSAPSTKYLPANNGGFTKTNNFGSQRLPSAPSTQYLPANNGGFTKTNNFGSQRLPSAPSTQYLPANNGGFPKTNSFGSQRLPSAPSTQYLPANNGHFAQTNGFVAQAPSSQYGVPSRNFGGHSNIPSGQYGAPSKYQSAEARSSILRFNNQNQGDGSYRFEYETENKISQQEAGELKHDGSQEGAQSVQGAYSYQGDDGKTYTVNYVADENGFRPMGDHISEDIQTLAKKAAQTSSQGYNRNAQASYHNGPSFQQLYSAPARSSFNQQSGYQY